MAQVSILGSGNVGANTAFFVAEKGITDVILYDIRQGLAQGKALDMMEAAPVRSYRNRIRGEENLAAMAGSELVVIAAGRVREPGQRRQDLYAPNLEVIRALAPEVARLAPDASVIVATEPVDRMTWEFVQASGLPRERVMGLGGFLDSTRLRYLIAEELGVSTENVSALVIGRHGQDMIALGRYSSVSGVPVTDLLDEERFAALVRQTRDSGDLIVSLAQRSSAYYAPSAAAAELVDAVHMDLRRILSVSTVLEGEYGLSGVALSLPCVIGARGIQRILTPRLTDAESRQLHQSAAQIGAEVGEERP
jgi:malate dehydrogenase